MARNSSDCQVAIVGAGPYGLSAGFHLKAKGIATKVFGEPMEFWANKMPDGMLLRSPRVASSLSDPNRAFTLEAYEAAVGKEPCAPVPLKTFVEYGKWFQQQLGSDLDRRSVLRVGRNSSGYRITLQDGEELHADRVVVAAGIGPFRKKPGVFESLSTQQVTHCYEGKNVRAFSGIRVAVIGGGQSALETAALLHEAGAQVEIIARQPRLKWIGSHPWLHQMGPVSSLLYSSHDVGPLGISRLVAYPNVVARVPLGLRDKIRVRAVRPAGSRWLPDRLASVRITTGRSISDARALHGEIGLTLDDHTERRVDHVILGTGYKVDISKYDFLSPDLVREVEQFAGYPKLSKGFRCSSPRLHFIGATAARTFGPLLYFVAGTEFASRHLTAYIAGKKD
jgi:cation diffusion facilitator CzcD-associated flavoprotein CzcO